MLYSNCWGRLKVQSKWKNCKEYKYTRLLFFFFFLHLIYYYLQAVLNWLDSRKLLKKSAEVWSCSLFI